MEIVASLKLYLMRHFYLLLSIFTVVATAAFAEATPVYLRLDSRFTSGHYPRKVLEGRTREIQFQQWLRVETSDKAYGWFPEDHLVTPLKLAQQALVTEDTPSRLSANLEALGGEYLKKNARVYILEVAGSWARVRPLPVEDTDDIWLPTSTLRADLKAPAAKAFIPTIAMVHILPGHRARVQSQIKEPRFVQVVKTTKDWVEILDGLNGHGFVRRADAVTLEDLGTQGVRPIFDMAPLRSAPLPYADLVRSLRADSPLKVIEKRSLRWGQANLKDLGQIWWPMIAEADESSANELRERITTPELFKRKIFDMATSPAIPALKFVSAQGIYRTNDGREWSRIPTFQDKNYPIAISGAGAVFIGPYMSDDQGETFEQWIRWDILVSTLRKLNHHAPAQLQIVGIQPQGIAGRRVLLKLNLGANSKVSVVTDDQGLSWHKAPGTVIR